jgi:hypothetical protein
MHPVSFWTSLMHVGAFMLVMAEIFSGLASMPRWLMMKPSSLPEGTAKMHLFGCDNPPRKIPYYRLRPIHFGH